MTTLQLLTSHWNFNIIVVLIALGFIAIHYVGNGNRFNRRSYRFLFGVFLFLLATLSPLNYLGHNYLFSAHMVQHILLLLIIPPLLLSGMNPEFLKRLVRQPRVEWVLERLFHPVVAWICGVGAMWIWHIPAVLDAMKNTPVLSALHMISLMILGFIFAWPVFSPLQWQKVTPLQSVLYLFTACVGCTILGIFITFAPVGLFLGYLHGGSAAVSDLIRNGWGVTPATDQQAGGLIMWVPACLIYLTDIMIVLYRYLLKGETEDVHVNPIKQKHSEIA